jgi:FkbM family methyltransferase
MKLFNRDIEPKKIVPLGIATAAAVLRIAVSFKRPLLFLRSYFGGTAPEARLLEMNDGTKLYLSPHVHDVITAFIIFGRRDYGYINSGSVIVDIGANIGVFALYASLKGCKAVYAIEPNSESYNILLKNSEQNNLQHRILPFQLAISNRDNQKVLIPIKSSPYNAILEADDPHTAPDTHEWVNTVTLESFCHEQNIDHIDLLKVDCEGAEFLIVPYLSADMLRKIRAIRMEYQDGDVNLILDHLKAHSYKVVKHEKDDRMNGGMLWMENESF